MNLFYTCLFLLLLLLQQLPFVLLVDISPCAIWERNATTVAGTGIPGDAPDQLYEPVGLFLFAPTNDLYIADHRNARIQKISLDNVTGIGTTVISSIFFPLHVYVDNDDNEPTIYVTLSVGSRVEKWIKGAQTGESIVTDCNDCVGVALDQDRNVYVTDTMNNQILKWSPESRTTSVVAGNASQSGSAPELLYFPQGVFVTQSGDAIYVADSANARIQKWLRGATKGITVAGLSNGTMGNDSSSLNNPLNAIVDEKTQIVYVADMYNHRIMRWLPGAKQGDIIAGLGGTGNSNDQLKQPADLKFDLEGNLYVSDLQNHRVQRFQLLQNEPCRSPSSSSGQYGPNGITTFLILLCLTIIVA